MEAAPRVCTNMSAPFDEFDTFVSFRGNVEVKGSDSSVVGLGLKRVKPHAVVICGFKYTGCLVRRGDVFTATWFVKG